MGQATQGRGASEPLGTGKRAPRCDNCERGDLADLFAYPDGSLWEHQHSLSLLMKDIMMEAIGKATRDAYGKLEKALGAVTEACKPALWPGVYWDVMPRG